MTGAWIYTALAALPVAGNLAGALGAPVGQALMGGQFPGRLPPAMRIAALAQAGILVGLACVMLDRGGALTLGLPGWLYGAALALNALSTLANAISRSLPERLWTPVVGGMFIAGLFVQV